MASGKRSVTWETLTNWKLGIATIHAPSCRVEADQASPSVSNSTLSRASRADLPAQMTNWNAWK